MTDVEDQKRREAEFYRQLEEQDLWIPRVAPPPARLPFKPIPVRGKPLSEMIIEERG